ncbi:MAG: flagellar biosynthesis anti-sigma factor FlgM [Rhodoferax sp.]
MKIGHPSDIQASVTQSQSPAAQKSAQGSSAAAAANAAQSTRSAGVAVTVSTAARGLEKSSRNEAADIDTQKVASVRAAIQDGTYVVNPEAIADKLLSNAQEMLNRTTR